MQKLDPSRFSRKSGDGAALHAQVLSDIDKLELQINARPTINSPGRYAAATALLVPGGYGTPVAEYFRRLSKNP